jgi:HEAT repeat protein
MNLNQVLDLLNQENVAANEMTGAFLEDAVASFAANAVVGTNAIRSLRSNDPTGFVLAGVHMLISTEERSPGLLHVAGLLSGGDRLLEKGLPEEEAVAVLGRNLKSAEPLLDARLVGKMLTKAGDIRAVDAGTALRVLSLVEAISDGSRLSSFLVQLMRHPNARVRSKAVLVLGRANLNLNRITDFMTSEDVRLRANAVESLWEWPDARVLTILREASNSAHRRVAINALVGLCRARDRDAFERLKQMADSADPLTRTGVAWAMNELADKESGPILAKLREDSDERVRRMAARAQIAPDSQAADVVTEEQPAACDQPPGPAASDQPAASNQHPGPATKHS